MARKPSRMNSIRDGGLGVGRLIRGDTHGREPNLTDESVGGMFLHGGGVAATSRAHGGVG